VIVDVTVSLVMKVLAKVAKVMFFPLATESTVVKVARVVLKRRTCS
jgi:hypothetical protein